MENDVVNALPGPHVDFAVLNQGDAEGLLETW
jgi:hypothetical protein